MNDSVKNVETNLTSPQCQYFVIRKKRLCRMTVKPGKHYCGEHEPQPKTEGGQTDTRIPCPNDPKHTCYASKLEKHLSICNARQQKQPDYIIQNVNVATTTEDGVRVPLTRTPLPRILQVIDKVNTLYHTYIEDKITTLEEQPIHSAVLPEFNEAGRTESSLRHLRQASSLLCLMESEGLVADNTAYVELGAGKGQLSYYAWHAWCARADSSVVLVDRAALRHKRDNKLKLSAYPHTPHAHSHTPHAHPDQSVCADVNHTKPSTNICDSDVTSTSATNELSDNVCDLDDSDMKLNCTQPSTNLPNGHNIRNDVTISEKSIHDLDVSDNTCNEVKTYAMSDNICDLHDSDIKCDSNVHRIRADLAHLSLERVPAVQACAGVVGYAKHLCGVATDLALRCMSSPRMLAKLRGAALAACCHHRCARAQYVAADALQRLGIDADDFNILLGIVSWATCGDGRSRDRRRRDNHTNTQYADNPEPDTNTHDCDNQHENNMELHENGNPGNNTISKHRSTEEFHKSDKPEVTSCHKHSELNCEFCTNNTKSTDSLNVFIQNTRKSIGNENVREINGQKIVSLDLTEREATELGTKNLNLGREQREAVGRRAKALLDWGRVLYLEECGCDARLVYYVPSSVSLENVCIVAKKRL